MRLCGLRGDLFRVVVLVDRRLRTRSTDLTLSFRLMVVRVLTLTVRTLRVIWSMLTPLTRCWPRAGASDHAAGPTSFTGRGHPAAGCVPRCLHGRAGRPDGGAGGFQMAGRGAGLAADLGTVGAAGSGAARIKNGPGMPRAVPLACRLRQLGYLLSAIVENDPTGRPPSPERFPRDAAA